MNNIYEEREIDGWAEHSEFQYVHQKQEEFVSYRGEKALSILQAKNHSLEPDMISGWRPKLPSCPLPITYKNQYLTSLLSHMLTEDRFYVVYLGPRYMNSVQINQQYSYYWRYRDRYSLNLAIIQNAVKNVGNQPESKIEVKSVSHKFDSSF